MKNKNIFALTALVCALCCALGLTACAPKTDTPKSTPDTATLDTPSLSSYCQILQTVLTDSYYTAVTDKIDKTAGAVKVLDPSVLSIPYGFLEKEGYDKQEILSYKRKCSSEVYIKGNNKNNLYVATLVGGYYGDEPYYTNYVLQYDLTQKEQADLEMLFKGNYLQASLFVQELSYRKKPASYTKASILEESYDKLKYYIENTNSTTKSVYSNVELEIISFDKETRTLNLNVRSVTSSSYDNMVMQGEMRKVTFYSPLMYIEPIGNNIYSSPTKAMEVNNESEFAIKENLTFYNCVNRRPNILRIK